eukprot:122107-Hanusia_phi.AAC.1
MLSVQVKMVAVNDNDGTTMQEEEEEAEEAEEAEEREEFMRYEVEEDAAVRAAVVEGVLALALRCRSYSSLALLVEGYEDESRIVQEAVRRCFRAVACESRTGKLAVYRIIAARMRGEEGEGEGEQETEGRRGAMSASARTSMLCTLIDIAKAEGKEEEDTAGRSKRGAEEEERDKLQQETAELLRFSSHLFRELMKVGREEDLQESWGG